MNFVYPAFLYAFAVLLIPIVIHLFNFKKYKTLYFSSIQFLKSVNEQTKSTQKLKHYLVLATRLLAFSALILAFAQPYIPTKTSASTTKEPVMAIYLDNSFSMSMSGTNGDLLNQGVEVIRKVVDNAGVGTNFMMLTNDLAGKDQRLISKAELIDRLDNIDYSSSSRNVSLPINTMKEFLDEKSYKGQRQYIMIGDFQKNSYAFDKIKVDTGAIYYPIQLIPQSYDNIYIDSVWFENPLRKINTNNILNIRIKNSGKKALNNVELSLNVNDYNREILVDLPANGREVAQINYTDNTTGLKKAKVEINDSQLYFDDKFYFSYGVKEKLNITVIQGKEASRLPSYVFQTDDYYSVKEIAVDQIQFSELKSSNLIILNELDKISSGLTAALTEYVENGKSVLIIPSVKAEIPEYNFLLNQLNLPQIKSKEDNAPRLNQINYDDPFFTGMFDDTKRKINLPKIKTFYKASENIKTNATSLVSFENNVPLFVKSNGILKAYMFYAGINETFGKIGEHAIFSSLLLRSGELSQHNNLLWLTLGENTSYPVFRTSRGEGPIHLKSKNIDVIPPTSREGSYDFISLSGHDIEQKINAEVYDIEVEGRKIDQLAVNYNRKESDVQALEESDILQGLTDAGIKNIRLKTVNNLDEINQLSLEKPLEYWRILLILAVVFFLIEMLILKLWKA